MPAGWNLKFINIDFKSRIAYRAWDSKFINTHFKSRSQEDQLILLLCGSASTWIEKNILSSTGFLGRVSQTLTLEELPLQDCAKFWPQNEGHISAYEKAKVLAITLLVPAGINSHQRCGSGSSG
jgi:hypothetical protein